MHVTHVCEVVCEIVGLILFEEQVVSKDSMQVRLSENNDCYYNTYIVSKKSLPGHQSRER